MQTPFIFNLHACANLICTLCKCIVFIQVLQLSFSAPLVADFPAGDKRSIMLLKVLSEIADEEEEKGGRTGDTRLKMLWSTCPPQHSSSLFIHINIERTQERQESQHKASDNNWIIN